MYVYVARYPGHISLLNIWQTAALGLFDGLKIKVPEIENLPDEDSDDEAEPESTSPVQKEKEKEKEKEEEDDPKDNEAPTVEDEASKLDNAAPKCKVDTSDQSTPTATEPKKPTKDWIVILGGATSVGKYAIQVPNRQFPKKNRHTNPTSPARPYLRLQSGSILLRQLRRGIDPPSPNP
jgi:cytoskeletal protein RodZ